ncbi:MAG: PSD1 and planctomycete cytochrome C domain-containing protein [Pirellulales bacterium]
MFDTRPACRVLPHAVADSLDVSPRCSSIPGRLAGLSVLICVIVSLLLTASAVADETPPTFTAEQLRFFEERVRPVFAEHCWECHGAKKQEAGLRLDHRAAVLRGSDSGVIVKAGAPDQSLLVSAVRRMGDVKMPPDRSLPNDAIEAIDAWVRAGLPWPAESPNPATMTLAEAARTHWSFQPMKDVAPPSLPADSPPSLRDWARDPLDLFILAPQVAAGLTPSPTASRGELFRRLSLDLLGLPPRWEEVEEFAADYSPDAFERWVDRWLASPRHGERWARHWLDIARYADTKGYVFFEDKDFTWAHTYRDYVIESLNRDLPYDRFVTEQLAADRLELAGDPRPLRALGFLTLGPHFMGNSHDIIDDRIDVVTRGLLGLTVTCARCHDHKYDPVPQTEYYGLYGVFRSCEEPGVPPLDSPPPDTDDYRKFLAELQRRESALQAFVARKHQDLVNGARTRVAEYLAAAYASRNQPATDDFMLIADPNDLNPTMTLRWRVFLEKVSRQSHPVWRVWSRLAAVPEASFSERAAEALQQALVDEPTAPPLNPRVRERFQTFQPKSMNEVAAAYAEILLAVDKQWRESLAAASAAKQPAPVAMEDVAAEQIRAALYGPEAPPDVPVLLGWGFLTLLPDRASQGEYQKLLKEVETHMKTGAGAPSRALVLFDSPQPYDARVFLRGNPNRLGDPAPRQFLAALNPQRRPFQQGSGRLELAREITSPANPLTARVLVNRLWLHHFNAAIVRTPGDFGLRGDPPTHPELLDRLATDFVRDGWSLKQLHRRLVTSATYRQASVDRAEAMNIDPDNRKWWRMNPRRLDFETFRDSMLEVAQSLDARVGGPSIKLLSDSVVPRRTLYGHIDRLDVPTLLTTFDFPNPAQSNPQRDQTTVAPQSLYLMNNGFVAEIARRIAARPELASVAGSDSAARIRALFGILYAREPSPTELERVQSFLGAQPNAVAWQRLTHALVMANEFVFID